MVTELETTDEIRNFWNSRYEKEGLLWGKVPSNYLSHTIEFLKDRESKKIIDVGCGYGRDVITLSKNGFDVVGVDLAEQGLAIGEEWAEKEGVDAKFCQMNAMELDFPDESFDAAVSNRFLHLLLHSGDRKKVVDEIHRVLKTGGCLSIALRGVNDPSKLNSETGKDGSSELKFRPGHKIRFITPEELYDLFEGKFEIYHIREVSERESHERDEETMLLHLMAEKR